jgi:hypothetical protein
VKLRRQCRTDLREMLHVPRAPDRATYSIPAASDFRGIKSQVSSKSSRDAVRKYTKTKIKFGLNLDSRHRGLREQKVCHVRLVADFVFLIARLRTRFGEPSVNPDSTAIKLATFRRKIDVSGNEVSWLPQNKTRRGERRAQVGLD